MNCECGGTFIKQYHIEYNPKKDKHEKWLSHMTCNTCFRNACVEQYIVSEW